MSGSREKILNRVRAAVAPLRERAVRPEWERSLVALRNQQPQTDAWARFAERFQAAAGVPFSDGAAFAQWAGAQGWKKGYCDPELLPALKPLLPAGVEIATELDRAIIDTYEFGITRADAAIAETGTLVLADRSTSRRLGALAPWTHVAVVPRERIFADLPAMLAAMPDDPNVIWVTGPSKTADVEGILIQGVHGPGVQVALCG
ncbi:lactate utilization protein C [Nibricoccus sp. IMCC34717]|uniref:LutC/YkgG family protein n=1 Tax=Nibricoccus sp. IMCC34717 TaxID=3034021 RepID=UPI00384FCF20